MLRKRFCSHGFGSGATALALDESAAAIAAVPKAVTAASSACRPVVPLSILAPLVRRTGGPETSERSKSGTPASPHDQGAPADERPLRVLPLRRALRCQPGAARGRSLARGTPERDAGDGHGGGRGLGGGALLGNDVLRRPRPL